MPLPCPRRRRLLASGLMLAASGAGAQPAQPVQPAPTAGRVWRVGAGQAISRIADALLRADDGDTIEILPGVYAGDVAVIRQRRLRLIGLTGTAGAAAIADTPAKTPDGPGSAQPQRPLIQAAGQHAEGKALWVVRDGSIHIENLDFEGARVPDGNGAAIRFERGQLRLTGCGFRDHQMGLLTGNHEDAELHIEGCRFSQAPANAQDLSHLVYVGRIGRFTLQTSQLSQGLEGHLLKSRARQTVIRSNLIDDGPGGQASYEIDLPQGGQAWVERNTVVQSATTRNSVMLAYGAEGRHWPSNRLTLRDNTFINRRPGGGWFVRVWADRLPEGTEVLSQHNRYLGPGNLLLGPGGRSLGDQRGPVPAG